MAKTKQLGRRATAKPQSPARVEDRRAAIKAHFKRSGILFLSDQDAVARRLQALIGPERAQAWVEINEQRMEGAYKGCIYDLFRTPEELNTLCSLQADLALDVAAWLDRKVAEAAKPGCRIADLGCGTGALAAWLAAAHPAAEVVAFDGHPGMLAAARSQHAAANLRIEAWDYRREVPASPASVDVLVTSMGVDWPDRSQDMLREAAQQPPRTSKLYAEYKAYVAPAFRHWRTLAAPGGVLHAVLRIPVQAWFFATLDAAHEAGWDVDLASRETIKSGFERLPALTFRAGQPSQGVLPEQAVRGCWLAQDVEEQLAKTFQGDLAKALYESLRDKCVVDEDSSVDMSGAPDLIHMDSAIVGHVQDFAFAYMHCTCGGHSLRILPRADATRIKARDCLPGGEHRERLLG